MEGWQAPVLLYVACAGTWSVLAKVASRRLDVPTVTFITAGSAFVVMAAATARHLTFSSAGAAALAVAGGVLAGAGSLAFYRGLARGPASLVLPLSSLSIVVTVVLSRLFLGESIGPRQMAGIAFGLLSILLLAR